MKNEQDPVKLLALFEEIDAKMTGLNTVTDRGSTTTDFLEAFPSAYGQEVHRFHRVHVCHSRQEVARVQLKLNQICYAGKVPGEALVAV